MVFVTTTRTVCASVGCVWGAARARVFPVGSLVVTNFVCEEFDIYTYLLLVLLFIVAHPHRLLLYLRLYIIKCAV